MMLESEVRLLREGIRRNRDFAAEYGLKDDTRRADAAINALSIVLGEPPQDFAEPAPDMVWGFLL